MNTLELKRHFLICPGETIQETIEEIGMPQIELAERMGRSFPKINELIQGKAPITKDVAFKLEFVLGIDADFWLNLEQDYQKELAELRKMEFNEECVAWLTGFPLALMKKLGLLPDTRNKPKLAEALLKFFSVASPTQWETIYQKKSIAFKIALQHTVEAKPVSVWLRIGELQATKLTLATFDKKQFRKRLVEAQEIAFLHPEDWQAKLQNLCAECGVALIYTPSIPKAPIYGATRWIKKNSIPLLQITDHRKDNNTFWFTFFHECGHILLHGKKDIYLEGLTSIEQNEKKEAEADNFAAKKLIKDSQMNEMLKCDAFDEKKIHYFSKKFRIHPNIIVGQLKRKERIAYNDKNFQHLKAKIKFAENNEQIV
ncbi:MAG: HigA family addiction module antitoxin [Chitinophagales bacterium]